MRARHFQQFLRGFRKRDIKHLLPAAHALEQELQRQRRLSRARIALHQIKTIARQTARENFIQAVDAAGTAGIFGGILMGGPHFRGFFTHTNSINILFLKIPLAISH
jgi:hypothetical protein